jgi:hypothetical protein
MNKHVLGAVVFSVVVGSFAIGYSLLFPTPIPELPALVTPNAEPRVEHCRRGGKSEQRISFEILSSNLLVSEERIVSKILVKLQPGAESPDSIFVQTKFTDASNAETAGFGKYEVIENPFDGSRERIVTVISSANTLDDNIYLSATVGELDPAAGRHMASSLTKTKAVLAVFGNATLSDSDGEPPLRRDEARPFVVKPY